MSATNDTHELTVYENELAVTFREMRAGGKREIDIEHEDGRKWRVVATAMGTLDHVETTWRDGQLADLDQPEWMDDLFARLAGPA